MPLIPAVNGFILWVTQHPLGSAVLFYIIGVFSVLVYAYFEAHDNI